MLLNTPSLDDKSAQDIVDEAKRLIPTFCPEWTDHNVSDPGVALIELFAWMTEMLVYRVNQVPDRMYIKFLELIGMELKTTEAAHVPITFYLSAAQTADFLIPSGTEVATPRTETNPAIIFTTEKECVVRPPKILSAYTYNASHTGQQDIWSPHDLERMRSLNAPIDMFPPSPAAQDAFCIAFEEDLSDHVIAITVDCNRAEGAGVDPRRPPLRWEVSHNGAAPWLVCEQEYDGTRGFNHEGENTIVLRLPRMDRRRLQELPDVNAYWLQCVLTREQGNAQIYKRSPQIREIRVEALGATTLARHATVVQDEVLGRSDNKPGQRFYLMHRPVLALDKETDYLIVKAPDGTEERWEMRDDFADSGKDDRHFTLDKINGIVTLGPALLQPDGSIYSFGRVPPKEAELRFSRYRYGGGVAGNVAAESISVLKENRSFITQVRNWRAAEGGRDAQSIEDAKLHAPQYLRTRMRAVTRDDHEYLAKQVRGVARACCVAPGAQSAEAAALPGAEIPPPGTVYLYVLPAVDNPREFIPLDRLIPSQNLKEDVRRDLEAYRMIGTRLEVRNPELRRVRVHALLRVAKNLGAYQAAEVQRQAQETLFTFLNPYIGGPAQEGWPFGRDLHASEIQGRLQRVPGVEYVEDTHFDGIYMRGEVEVGRLRLALPRHGLVCSELHQIDVQPVID